MAHTMHRAVSDLMEQIEITPQEIERRKAFLEFGAEDIRALESINTLAEQYADEAPHWPARRPPEGVPDVDRRHPQQAGS